MRSSKTKILNFILAFSVFMQSFSLFALDVKIETEDLKLFSGLQNLADPLAVLPKGSVVEIPDAYIVKNSSTGNVNINATLEKYLANAQAYSFAGADGKSTMGMFLPVKIKKIEGDLGPALQKVCAKPGVKYQTKNGVGTSGECLLNVENFRFKNNAEGTEFATRKETPVYEKPVAYNSETEAGVGRSSCEDCAPGNEAPKALSKAISNLLENYSYKLNGDIINYNSSMNDSVSGKAVDSVIKTFEKTCGVSWSKTFLPYLNSKAKNAGVPTEILLSLMTKESGGSCAAVGDSGNSLGLFQVNRKTPGLSRACIAKPSHNSARALYEESKLKKCPKNPFSAVDIAIDVMKSKAGALFPMAANQSNMSSSLQAIVKGPPPTSKNDALRIILSAYNGGESWVDLARSDLNAFNKKFKSKMNPNSWEDLRLFYLRKLLKPEIISQSDKGSRANYYAVFNMVYVDSILPRDGHNTKSLSSIWTERYIF